MIITELQQLYATHPNVEGMCKLLKDDSVRHLYCSGLCASAASLFSSVLVQRAECPFVFILGDLEEAGYFYHDLTQILGTGQVLFFPSSFRRAIKYGQKDAANEILRTEVLSRLQKGEEGLCVVTYPDALAEKVVSRKELGDKTLKLHVGEKVDMDFVTEVLRSYGFEYVDYVYEPGQYAVRGSIIDVFSFSSEFPFRIDFFGDEVESIRTFEVESQLSKEKKEEIVIVPDFYILIGQYLDTYHKKDKKMVRACITHLRLFTRKKSLPVTLLTKDFCINFLEYLRDHLRGNTPIGYFKKFRMCINKCIEKKLMTSNPTDGIRLMQFDEVTKAILSLKEIQKLAITPCPNNEVKRAFLFSCYCGLRWCDVHQLQYKDIDFSSNRLTILQQKVQSHSKNAILHLNLNHTAIKLLQRHKGINEELVFGLPSYSYTLRILNKWVKRANIHKHITFHCARHSFITNIMANGANIKTAASLAGHSTTRHTEKYVHIIDELKQKAVDSLPDIIVNYK